MTNQFTRDTNDHSDNEPEAADESKSSQVFLPPEPKQWSTFTRRHALVIGGACVVGLLGIGVGTTLSVPPSYIASTPPAASNTVAGLVWSPDGTSLASYNDTGYNGTSNVQIWEAMSGRLKYTFAESALIARLAWSPDSSMLAIGTDTEGSDGSLKIFHSATGALYRSLRLALANGISASSSYVAWSPDGRHIATGDAGMFGSLGLWSTTDWSPVPIKQLPGQSRAVRGLGWSPDSQKLLLTFEAEAVRDNKTLGMVVIWDMQTQQAILTRQVATGDDDPILDSGKGVEMNIGGATWSPDSKMFAIGTNQQALVFSGDGQLRFKRGTFGNYALAPLLAWSPTNLQRLAGWFSPDPTIYIWNPFTNQLIQHYATTVNMNDVSFAWSPDGKYLAFSDGSRVQFRAVQ